jgi:hypothetical protein
MAALAPVLRWIDAVNRAHPWSHNAHLTAMLRPGGRLIVVGCYRPATMADHAVDVLAIPANLLVGLAKTGHAAAARIAMSAPTAPARDTLADIRAAFPTATPHRRLFWRYTLTT